jgi:thioredoxin-related protein
MKTKSVILVLLLTLVTSAFSQTNFSDGISKGKSQNKKILVNIYSENDTWSKKMETVYAVDAIKNYVNGNFIYVKLNANGSDKISYSGKDWTSSSLSKFLGATGYPTHVVLNSDGSVIKFTYNSESMGSFSGYLDSPEFEKFLKYFAENKFKDTDLGKVL